MSRLDVACAIALATTPPLAQVPQGDVTRVIVLHEAEPDHDLTLDLPDGWPRGLQPFEFVTSDAGIDRLLEAGRAIDFATQIVRPIAAPHLEIALEFDRGAKRARGKLAARSGVPTDAVSVEGNFGTIDSRGAPRTDSTGAVSMILTRSDLTREVQRRERSSETPVVERAEGSDRVSIRFLGEAGAARTRRRWVAIARGETRVEIFPMDVPIETQGAAPVEPMAPATEAITVPRYALHAVSESFQWNMRDQGERQLEDAAIEWPASPEIALRRAVVRIARGEREQAIGLLEAFLNEHGRSHAAVVRLLEWASALPASSRPRTLPRRGRAEVLGDPSLDESKFAAMAEAAATTTEALSRLHFADRAETFVVLFDSQKPGTGATTTAEGFIELLESPIAEKTVDLARGLLLSRPEMRDATNGVEMLAPLVAAYAGRRDGDGGADKKLVGPGRLARRVLDAQGPAALARLILETRGEASTSGAEPEDIPPAGSLDLEHLGHACFRLTAPDGTRLLIDPFSSRYWLNMRFPWVAADFVAITHEHDDHSAIDEVLGHPRRLSLSDVESAPAKQEIDAGPFHVAAFRTDHDHRYGTLVNLVLRIDVAGLRIVHLGDVQAPLSEELSEKLGPIDILLAPIDDSAHLLDAAQLAEIVERLSPRVLVPMHWRVMAASGNGAADEIGLLSIDEWLKLAPRVKRLGSDRIRVSSKALPNETTTFVFPLAPWPTGRLEPIR